MKVYNENYYKVNYRYNNYEEADKTDSLINSFYCNSNIKMHNKRKQNTFKNYLKNKNLSQDNINLIKIKKNFDLLNNKLIQFNNTFLKINSFKSDNRNIKRRNNSMINIKENNSNSCRYDIDSNYKNNYIKYKYKINNNNYNNHKKNIVSHRLKKNI